MNKLYVDINRELVEISVPKLCPCCHTGIIPSIQTTTSRNRDNNFAVIFSCPSCNKYFFYSYTLSRDVLSEDPRVHLSVFFDSNPTLKLDLNIPEEIKNISPNFLEIYTQALTVEHYKLDKITGIALRKSIEFLIKDYLIKFKKEDPEIIKNIMLGKAILKINNPTIQTLSRAVTWIGNDETHYERRYEDKDVNDMKRFIRALIHFISFEVTASEAEDFVTTP